MRVNRVLNYLVQDHLGSTALVTDNLGNLVSEQRYKAWGETRYRSSAANTDYLYTGQREVTDIGLYFYNARWYDSTLGRFVQADTIIPSQSTTLSFDRFSYTFNNPIRYRYPSGHDPWYIPGYDPDYLMLQDGNTCAVVSIAFSLSILSNHKYSQTDIQPLFINTYKIFFGGIGVVAVQQAWVINHNAFPGRIEATLVMDPGKISW